MSAPNGCENTKSGRGVAFIVVLDGSKIMNSRVLPSTFIVWMLFPQIELNDIKGKKIRVKILFIINSLYINKDKNKFILLNNRR